MDSPTEEQAAVAPSPADDDATALLEQERKIRNEIAKSAVGANPVAAFAVNIYASIIIFAFHLISLESILSMALSVGMTIGAYYITEDSTSFDGSAMDWVLLSFAVITPMSASIGMAFTRREKALDHLAVIKATLWSIYSAHACWDWKQPGNPNSGRAALPYDWVVHTDEVLRAILGICNETNRLLTLPEDSRSRHRSTPAGRAEAERLGELRSRLHWRIYGQVTKLTDMCEVFKVQGLPPNEATRVRQYERFVTERIEMLVMIKKYRTPQALRSFARLFTVFLPPFYAPYYAQMAEDINSLGLAIAFSVLTSLALTSLFESITQIEDPFVSSALLDGIHVAEELGDDLRKELLVCRSYHFPDSKPFVMESEDPPFKIQK